MNRPAIRDGESGDVDIDQPSVDIHGVEGVSQTPPQFLDLYGGDILIAKPVEKEQPRAANTHDLYNVLSNKNKKTISIINIKVCSIAMTTRTLTLSTF